MLIQTYIYIEIYMSLLNKKKKATLDAIFMSNACDYEQKILCLI